MLFFINIRLILTGFGKKSVNTLQVKSQTCGNQIIKG